MRTQPPPAPRAPSGRAGPGLLTRRRLLGTGLAAAAASALAACGGPAAGRAGEPGAGSLRLLTPIFDRADGQRLLERLLAQFRRTNPGISVTVDYTLYPKLNEKITTSLVSGRPYDVMMMGVGWIPPFAERGLLAELKADQAELDRLYHPRVIRTGCRYKGALYARPVVLDCRMGVYRKDLLEQAGIHQPPRTLTELRQMARDLTVRKNGTLRRAGMDVLSYDPRQMFLPLMWAHGGELFRDGRPAFAEDEAVAGLQWMVDLIHKDRSEDYGFASPTQVASPLIQGRAVMGIAHNDLWRQVKEIKPELITEGRIGAFTLREVRPAMFQGGTLATVSASSQHLLAAQELARFLSSPDVALQAGEQRGNIPATLPSSASAYVRGDALVHHAVEHLDEAHSEGGVPQWLDIRDQFKPAIEGALLGRAAPHKALRELADQAHTIMNRRV